MSSLSNKSAQEISELLDEYGIKHGPVVGEWHRLSCLLCAPVWIGLTDRSYLSSFTCNKGFAVSCLLAESTRGLYEKKLKEAMAKSKRAKPSPDKTYYREEGTAPIFSFHMCLKFAPCPLKGGQENTERLNHKGFLHVFIYIFLHLCLYIYFCNIYLYANKV